MDLILSGMNFFGGKDGNNIKFTIGGDSIDTHLELGYYCIDIHQMQDHKGIAGIIVDSYFRNYPYYPCPGMPHWNHFKVGYLAAARLGEQLEWAQEVIVSIEDKYSLPTLSPSHNSNIQDHSCKMATITKKTRQPKRVQFKNPIVEGIYYYNSRE